MTADQTTKTVAPVPYKRYADKGDLTTGSIPKHIIRLTIPMLWGILAVISVQVADTYFISLLGTTELAAIGFTYPVTMIITHLLFGINVALSSVVSRLLGQKMREDARRVVLHAILMAFGLSCTIAILSYIFLDPIFRLIGADQNALIVIREYMPIWLISAAILSIPVNSNSAMRAGGDATLPAIVMISLALINVVLDPIFIFGYFGMPEMGVKGAAFATLLAHIWAAGLAFYFLKYKKDLVATSGLFLDKFKDSVKRLVVIAIPAGIGNIVQPVTNAVIVAMLASYGAEAVAAYGVAIRVEGLALVLVIALALGISPIIGQNWGAKNYMRVHNTINISIIFNIIWSLLIAAILGIFAYQVASVFSDDPAVIDTTTLFFWIVPFSYAFGNLVFGWSFAFNAMGMPQKAFVMIIVKSFVITLPAVWFGSEFYGITGILWGLALSNVVSGVIFHALSYRTCIKQEKRRED